MYARWIQNASLRYLALSILCIALEGVVLPLGAARKEGS